MAGWEGIKCGLRSADCGVARYVVVESGEETLRHWHVRQQPVGKNRVPALPGADQGAGASGGVAGELSEVWAGVSAGRGGNGGRGTGDRGASPRSDVESPRSGVWSQESGDRGERSGTSRAAAAASAAGGRKPRGSAGGRGAATSHTESSALSASYFVGADASPATRHWWASHRCHPTEQRRTSCRWHPGSAA
jgi:hypothetical protein